MQFAIAKKLTRWSGHSKRDALASAVMMKTLEKLFYLLLTIHLISCGGDPEPAAVPEETTAPPVEQKASIEPEKILEFASFCIGDVHTMSDEELQAQGDKVVLFKERGTTMKPSRLSNQEMLSKPHFAIAVGDTSFDRGLSERIAVTIGLLVRVLGQATNYNGVTLCLYDGTPENLEAISKIERLQYFLWIGHGIDGKLAYSKIGSGGELFSPNDIATITSDEMKYAELMSCQAGKLASGWKEKLCGASSDCRLQSSPEDIPVADEFLDLIHPDIGLAVKLFGREWEQSW